MVPKIAILFLLLCLTNVARCLEFDEAFNSTVDFLIKEINPNNIANMLRHLSRKQHLGGTEAEWETAQWVEDTWRAQGLDDVETVPYDVLLSYPEKENPNYARIESGNGEVKWRSQGRTPALHSPEESLPDIFPDFNAFSPPGNVTGDIIFVHYGREKDFDSLPQLGLNVSGKIVIAKYGKVFRSNIVYSAQIRGAVGVLLYSDPDLYAQDGQKQVYPNAVWMPDTAAPYGTTYLKDGDPLTPYYPSIKSAFRLPEDEAVLPKIPVMPLSYKDAREILSKMDGEEAPPEWRGGLNITYKLGPGLMQEGDTVTMEVNTHNKRTTIKNVIGMIRGSVEPDRYVILGNHRDAWVFGAVDPSSGTSVMMELSRTFMEMKNQTGWTPRRSIVFCSWGAEEYGMIGSQEWVEQFSTQLVDRAVAYLNVDMSIEGNFTTRAKSAPLLNTVTREITKLIPNPDPCEIKRGMLTVFDTWADRNPDPEHPGLPGLSLIGSGSDYKAFQHKFGIPSMDYRYTHSKKMGSEPLYHTLYETFYLVDQLYDRGFHFHTAIAQMWGALATYLSDEQILPMSVSEYAKFIDQSQKDIMNKNKEILKGREKALGYFSDASQVFSEACRNFEENVLPNINKSDELAVRRVNDQLMQVERSFIDRRGLPGRPDYNHVIVAPSSSDSYAGAAFSGLTDALHGIAELSADEQKVRWRTFDEHLAVCTHFLMVAGKTLTEELW